MGSGGSKKRKESTKSEKKDKEKDYDYLFKVGNAGVGKTSILEQYSEGVFEERDIKNNSLMVDFRVKTIRVGSSTVKLQIWDTAGQERFRTITSSYYVGAHLAFVTYDVTSAESFNDLPKHLKALDRYAPDGLTKGVIGNKYGFFRTKLRRRTDLASDKIISTAQATEFCDSCQVPLFEVSAKTGDNIEAPFLALAQTLIEQLEH